MRSENVIKSNTCSLSALLYFLLHIKIKMLHSKLFGTPQKGLNFCFFFGRNAHLKPHFQKTQECLCSQHRHFSYFATVFPFVRLQLFYYVIIVTQIDRTQPNKIQKYLLSRKVIFCEFYIHCFCLNLFMWSAFTSSLNQNLSAARGRQYIPNILHTWLQCHTNL